jgi:hypothetical protein
MTYARVYAGADGESHIEDVALAAHVDAIERGEYPDWRVILEDIEVESVATPLRDQIDVAVGRAHPAQAPVRVWTIVLEHTASGQRGTLKFALVGGDRASPVWERIRA